VCLCVRACVRGYGWKTCVAEGTEVGLVRTIYLSIYSIFGWEITKNTVMYDVYTRFWPTLDRSDRRDVRGGEEQK
jgi:hypothetical protein